MTENNIEQPKITEPKKVTEPFLVKTNKPGWTTAFIGKEEKLIVKELKPFSLLLMKNNKTIDVIEGVQPGIFKLKSGNEEKEIALTPEQIHSLNYSDQRLPVWVAHEDNMFAYPQVPLMSAEFFRKQIQKIAMNYKDANEAKILGLQNQRMWIWIAGIAIVGLLAWMMIRGYLSAKDIAPIVSNVTQTVINATTTVGIPL